MIATILIVVVWLLALVYAWRAPKAKKSERSGRRLDLETNRMLGKESAFTRDLLSGAIGATAYRAKMEQIAARDAIRNPTVVPP